MENGRIKHQGTYHELVAGGVQFAGAIDVAKNDDVTDGEADNHGSPTRTKSTSANETEEDKEGSEEAGKNLIEEENRDEGRVTLESYIRYAKAGGVWLAIIVLVVQSVGRVFEVVATFWLARWSDDMSSSERRGEPLTDGEISFYIGIYGLFSALGVFFLGARGIYLAKHRLVASKEIHDNVVKSVLRAPISFFDVTPVGRILSRFAYDTNILDLQVSQSISIVLTTVTSFLGSIGGILVATRGFFLIALGPLTYLYYLLQLWFRRTSTEVKRAYHISQSPLFADFSQMLVGTSTIRAYGVQGGFFEKYCSSLDFNTACNEWVNFCDFWLAMRLDVLGGIVSMIIAAGSIATLRSNFIPAGYLGLALSFSIELTIYLKFGAQMLSIMEAHMSSVDRIFEYTDKIEPEAPDELEMDPDPNSWPSKGEIEISDASMRYRDGPLVLKGLNFKIRGGEKIGVCGRTGSGKSSLMIALFRISELETDGGRISIDGLDTRALGTDVLRHGLSIIPQDPVLFSTSVRFNLDPFEKKTDDELWDILRKVHMADVVAGMGDGLDEPVPEGGDNFSQGQKQLLCIGRALVMEPKILIMDEATASIDNATDAAVQEMIRVNFKNSTVLTIAHRLNTIMDSDRVLVLDKGNVAELDTPRALLSKREGIFKSMVARSQEVQK